MAAGAAQQTARKNEGPYGFARYGPSSTSPGGRERCLLHVGDGFVAAAADLEQRVVARHVAGLVELMVASGALVVDVLAFGDQLLGLGPFARQDRLARRASN